MKNNYSEYLKFIDEAAEIVKSIPRHFSKFSNRIFCNHQKIILLVLKQKLRTTYRDLIEILKMSYIPLLIGLKRIPHHTTLVKFAKKIKPSLLNLLLPFRKAKIVAVDGTGFEVENKSAHYQFRTSRSVYHRYIKLGISVDLTKQIILRQSIHKSPRHDCKDFMSLIKDIKPIFVCADKGYDSEINHKFIIKNLNAKSYIPTRDYGCKRIPRSNRKYRNQARREFNEKLYHQRSKVETVFSVIKKRYSSCLKARTFDSQKKEIICKLIAYNLDRIIKFYLILLRVSAEPKNQNI